MLRSIVTAHSPVSPLFADRRPMSTPPARASEEVVLGLGAPASLSAGEILFMEGDEARFFYRIVDGCVCAYKLMADGRRQITGFHFRGDLVGVNLNGIHIYGIEAIAPTRLQRYARVEMSTFAQRRPELARWLLDLATSELTSAQDQMLLLGRKSAAERLASFLLRMARHGRDGHAPAAAVSLPMTRAHIADYLGLTVETVSRTFTQFRAVGLIALHGSHTVGLTDPDALADIADGCDASLREHPRRCA